MLEKKVRYVIIRDALWRSLHKREINRLVGEISTQGMTIVPLKVYIKGSLVKVEVGLARGKKFHDKRDDIAKKDIRCANEREFEIKNI